VGEKFDDDVCDDIGGGEGDVHIIYKLSNKRSVHNTCVRFVYKSKTVFGLLLLLLLSNVGNCVCQKGKTRRETLYITRCTLHRRRQTAGGRT